jgi:hypothetical protein
VRDHGNQNSDFYSEFRRYYNYDTILESGDPFDESHSERYSSYIPDGHRLSMKVSKSGLVVVRFVSRENSTVEGFARVVVHIAI